MDTLEPIPYVSKITDPGDEGERVITGPNGGKLCHCGCLTPLKGRQRKWCDPDHWMRVYENLSWPDIRHAIGKRDGFVCVLCGRDCHKASESIWKWRGPLYRDREARSAFLKWIGLTLGDTGKSLWQVDHILPRSEGGDNSWRNLRVLCTWCHKKETSKLAGRLAAARRRKKMSEVIMGIDPSSTCTGWAVGHREGNQVDVIRFDRLRPPSNARNARERIIWMANALWGIIEDHQPARAVIEVTSGKVNRGRHGGGGAGLAVYGMAAGFLWATCHLHPDCGQAVAIPENDWTNAAGYKKKSDREWKASVLCPAYSNFNDPDYDVADAICLLNWYCAKRNIAERSQLIKGA